MTTLSEESRVVAEERRSWLKLEAMWGSLSIIVIWLAVLFDAVYGPNMTFANGAQLTNIPSVAVVAVFAMVATCVIATRVFGERGHQD
jgi:hypothetical protein